MPRPTLAPLSQDRLVIELKRTIDTARWAPRGSAAEVAAINAVIDLVEANSASATKPHVTHNLGCTRRTWLRHLATTMPASLGRDLMEQMGCAK